MHSPAHMLTFRCISVPMAATISRNTFKNAEYTSFHTRAILCILYTSLLYESFSVHFE